MSTKSLIESVQKYGSKKPKPHLHLKDGTVLSVQTGWGIYSQRGTEDQPPTYETMVIHGEGGPLLAPYYVLAPYDDEGTFSVQIYVPQDVLIRYIESHGGITVPDTKAFLEGWYHLEIEGPGNGDVGRNGEP